MDSHGWENPWKSVRSVSSVFASGWRFSSGAARARYRRGRGGGGASRGGGWDLKQFQQIFPAQTCLVKNINKCPFCELLMQRNDGSIGCLMCGFLKRYMAALLPDFNESCLFKRSDQFFPRNNWQFRHGLLQLWSTEAWISHEADLPRSFRYKAQ